MTASAIAKRRRRYEARGAGGLPVGGLDEDSFGQEVKRLLQANDFATLKEVNGTPFVLPAPPWHLFAPWRRRSVA